MPTDHTPDHSPDHSPDHDAQEGASHTAGAFDIRTFIGALIGIYGIVLVVTGLVSADGRTINVTAGVAMIIGAAVFFTWARLRPVVVPESHDESSAAQSH
jgi:hypothetical protein